MCADYIFRQGKRLQTLSYKLLEMTMAEAQKLERKEIPIPELVEELKRVSAVSLTEKQMTLLWMHRAEAFLETGICCFPRF